MSVSQKVIARAIKDDPWLVSAHPPKEMYAPRSVRCKKIVKRSIPVEATVTAKEAREHGVELEPGIPDDQMVVVEVPQEIEEEQTWWETRLCFNGRLVRDSSNSERSIAIPQRAHRQKMREEIAAAIESPLSFVHYEKLVDLIDQEIDHWKSTNMNGRVQRPIVLVLLGLHEPEDEKDSDVNDRIYSRDVYFIKQYSSSRLLLVSPRNEEVEVELEPGILDLCYSHNFILFVPSNVHFYDLDGEMLV